MKRILIPIDFSDNADRALAAAKIIANIESTQLIILHAYQPYITDVSLVPPVMGSTDFLPLSLELEREFKDRLENYAKTLRAEGYDALAIWSAGSIRSVVEEATKEHNPDLIVMGRTGAGGFLDKIIGSSATHIALEAPCPVMIIPPQVSPKRFNEVVYATQFEYEENDILREVFILMKHLGSRISLLKVNADTQPDIQPDNQYIEQIKNEFPISGEDIVVRKASHVINGIEAYCDEIKADLLIMSSRERSFIEEYLINPSVTKRLVVHTHIPLLVFHLK